MVGRTYNQAFWDYSNGQAEGEWDGFAVGSQTLELGGVTCQGPVRVEFGADYQAPARAQLRCDDGTRLVLHYEGSADLQGAGYDDITGVIRR